MTKKTGLLGYPLVEDQYTVCSDVYGHRIQLPRLGYEESFLEAVGVGYDNCKLHGNGHLVVDKATDKLAFLVTVRFEGDILIPAHTLVNLSARYGVPVRLMVMQDGGPGLPAYPLIAAQLDRIEQFDIAYALTADIVAAEDKARASS